MIRQFIPTVMTAVALVAGYWAYALAVVPWIEPERAEFMARDVSPNDGDAAPVGDLFAPLLAAYFPADHWSRAAPSKVLKSDQVALVFSNFDETENGRVQLAPVALVVFPRADETMGATPRDAIIVEAPEGALFQFVGGFRTAENEIGKFDWGVLKGDVTIRSDMREEGPDDDLLLNVSEVQINERRIWSNSDVAFRLGPNFGSGTNLEIRFLQASETEGPRRAGLDVRGVRSVEITKNVDATMALGDFSALNDDAPDASPRTNEAAPDDSQTPARVTCDGSFIFHFERRFARFDKNVRVTRANPVGPPDSLACHMLDIEFDTRAAEPSSDSATDRRDDGTNIARLDLQPAHLVARGAPVIVNASSSGAHARCETLTYDVADQRVTLETATAEREVTLQMESNTWRAEVRGQAVSYRLDPQSPRTRIGELRSVGRGALRAIDLGRDDASEFTASWNDRVVLARDKGQPVLSLYGAPTVGMGPLGQLGGDEIHLWLVEPLAASSPTADAAENRPPLALPDKLGVFGNVTIRSERLNARLGELQVWFQHVDANGNGAGMVGDDELRIPDASAGPAPLRQLVLDPNKPDGPPYDLVAGLLQMNLSVTGMATADGRAAASVQHLRATSGVALTQQAPPGAAGPELEIRGEQLHVENAESPRAVIELVGAERTETHAPIPASITSRGATIRGRAIHLDRGANSLIVNSPGEMTLPLDRDLTGRPTARPIPVTIAWNDHLNFDGKRAVFSGGVLARGVGGWMRADQLTTTMRRAIDFGASTFEHPDIDQLACAGNVAIDRQETDGSAVIGQDHFEAPTLTIERGSGAIRGRGPGWMRSTRLAGSHALPPTADRGRDRTSVVRGQTPGAMRNVARSSDPTPRRPASRLRYVRIDFQDRLDGNLNHREVRVSGQVRAVYGPVDSWEQTVVVDGPRWKDGGMLLDCDQLQVAQLQGGPRDDPWIEMVADGSVEIEGFTPEIGPFAAQAQRLTYHQGKDLLILDGGAGDARLWRERTSDAPAGQSAARKIYYARSQNRVTVEDARSLDLSQFPQ